MPPTNRERVGKALDLLKGCVAIATDGLTKKNFPVTTPTGRSIRPADC